MRSSSRAETRLPRVFPRSRKTALTLLCLRWLGLLCGAGLTSSASAQPHDDPPPLRVVLSAPADGDCINEGELAARVTDRLGRQVISDQGATESVRVQLARAESGSGWRAVLSAATRGAPAERRIDSASASCRDLDDALVLVLAAHVGVARPGEGAEAEPTAEPPPEPPREPVRTLEEPPHAERDAFNAERLARARAARQMAYPLSWSFAATGALATGRLPGLGWGASSALQLEWRRLTLVLGALAFPAVAEALEAGAKARFASVAGLLRVCGTVLPGTWLRAALCMGASSGAVYARTSGLAQNTAAWLPVTDGELGLRISGLLAWKVRWLIQLSGALPFTRMRFVFDESGGQRRVYHRVAAGVLLEVGGIIGGSS